MSRYEELGGEIKRMALWSTIRKGDIDSIRDKVIKALEDDKITAKDYAILWMKLKEVEEK